MINRIVIATFMLFFLINSISYAKTPKEDLIALGKKVEKRVAAIRGLPVKTPIRWELTSKQEVTAYLHKTLAEQYQPLELENEGEAMKALGLIPRSMNYKEFMISLYEEQVGGYYDPQKKTFYLADWIVPAMQEPIISHELTHALQDQSFDIRKFMDRIRGNSDAMIARMALVEGEATLVMIEDSMKNMGMNVDLAQLDLDGPLGQMMTSLSAAQFPNFSKAPRAIQESLMFPYFKGLSFVVFGKKQAGWKTINSVYSDLPASTEQVLHPEKYFSSRENPVEISLNAIDGLVKLGWQQIFDDLLGEFMTRQLLAPIGNRDEENSAAAGWAGDRVRVYRRGQELAWIQLSAWDSEQDAVEFAGALAKTVLKRLPDFKQQPISKQPRIRWKNAENHLVLIEKFENRVLVIENLEEKLASKIRSTVLKISP